MKSNSRRPGRGPLQTALTPLLDTLFLLLFTVLATSTDAPSPTDVPRSERVAVELPAVDETPAAEAATADSLTVTLVARVDGSVAWVGEGGAPESLAGPAALRARLEALDRSGDVLIEIAADGDTPHRVVIDLLQTARGAEAREVRFVAEALDGPADRARTFGAGGGR